LSTHESGSLFIPAIPGPTSNNLEKKERRRGDGRDNFGKRKRRIGEGEEMFVLTHIAASTHQTQELSWRLASD
jgi:hypothetical protein